MLDETLESTTIGERTYRRIRADIVFGRLVPGERLTLDRMREIYSTSVSTLREVLSRLCAEGLAIAEGSRGFEVMPISADNLRQLAAMRCLLEAHALRESFEAGDMEWEGDVVAAHHKLATIYDRYLRYQMIAGVYRGDVAATEHRRLLDSALKRDWKSAQATLAKHVNDCVTHMISKRLVT